MAKLLMVVTGDAFDRMSSEVRRAWHRQICKHMDNLIKGKPSLIMFMPSGVEIQLFKVESDGVEELQSVTVRYEDNEGNEIKPEVRGERQS